MKPGRHVPFLERPDEDAPAQTKTNNKLANKHAGLHEKTANLKQARASVPVLSALNDVA